MGHIWKNRGELSRNHECVTETLVPQPQKKIFVWNNRPKGPIKLAITMFSRTEREYDKCSKILNTHCLPKRPRQIGQTQSRLLLKKQSDQGLPYLLP